MARSKNRQRNQATWLKNWYSSLFRRERKTPPAPTYRIYHPGFELLEDRTVMDFSVGSTTFPASGADLYLKVLGGVLQFNTDGSSNYTSTNQPITGSTNVVNSSSGTLYLTGMDSGGGNYSTPNSIQVTGNLTTKANPFTLNAISIAVGALVVGGTGAVKDSGGHSYSITANNVTNQTFTLTTSQAPLVEGELVTFSGTSGTGPFTLQDGTVYKTHIVKLHGTTSADVQLFQPNALAPTIDTSSTSGPGGDIIFTADSSLLENAAITVGPGSHLTAKGTTSDGAISLTATNTPFNVNILFLAQFEDLVLNSFHASVSVAPGASIIGGDVTLSASSGDKNLLSNLSANAATLTNSLTGPIASYLQQWLSLPISILFATASSTAELGQNASINSTGSVTISSEAVANATGEATYWLPTFGIGASFAFGKASTDSEALVSQNATITATGDVSVTSNTQTQASSTSLVTQNNLQSSDGSGDFPINSSNFQLSGGYNNLSTISHAIVSQGATIMVPSGNANISAIADDDNTLNVQTTSFQDGFVGLSGAGADVNADVKAYVDGTITAGAHQTGKDEIFNPFLTSSVGGAGFTNTSRVDYAGSRILFATDPGYTTGEALSYSSSQGGPIPGLQSNTIYYAIAGHANGMFFVQLATSLANARSGKFIPFGQYPTLNNFPITNVSAASDEIFYTFNPGFTEGQAVTFAPAAGQFLGFDNSSGRLAGPLSSAAGAYKIHIVNSSVSSSSLYAIQLIDSSGNTVQLDSSPVLTTSTGQVIRVLTINAQANLIVLNQADLAGGVVVHNGDTLKYTAGLAANVTGLGDGTTYFAVVDASQFQSLSASVPVILQLAATLNDAQAANPVRQNPSFTWTDGNSVVHTSIIQLAQPGYSDLLFGPDHAFTIVQSDASSKILTVSEQPGAVVAALTEGELLTYQGATGGPGTLQNGQTYRVHIIDQSNPNQIQIQLSDALRLPTLGTLTESAGAQQSFSIDLEDATANIITIERTGAGAFTPLTDGESLVYTGASIAGFLQNGQSYLVHVVQQTSPSLIQVQLTPGYFAAGTAKLTDSSNNPFVILSSDPNTKILTLNGFTQLTNGEILTYSASSPAFAQAGYLQPGQQYVVTIPNAANPLQVQLTAVANQIASSGTLQSQTGGHSFTITGANSGTGILTLAEQGQSEFTSLTEGEVLQFQGPSAGLPNGLQNGQYYTVHIINQSNLQAIQVQLHTTPQLAGFGTLSGAPGSYVIHESDQDGTLWLSQVGGSQALTDGALLTYTGTSGFGANTLQNGQVYSVTVVGQGDGTNPDSQNIRIKLSQYVLPTYGSLAGTGHSFTIQDFNPAAQSVVISENPGAAIVALTEGESLTFTGASIAGTDLLQSGHTYTVHILDQSDQTAIVIQLLDPTDSFVVDSTTDGVNAQSNGVFVDPSQTPIPAGTTVTYHAGGAKTEIGGLVDGVTYQVVVDANNPALIHLVQTGGNAGQTVQITTDETLTANGAHYVITGSNGFTQTLTIQPGGGAPALTEGQAVVYTGALGATGSSLVDGQTYFVHIPVPTNPNNIQLQLTAGVPSSTLGLLTVVQFGNLDQSYLSGATHHLKPVYQAGINIVAQLQSNETISVASDIGDNPTITSRLPGFIGAKISGVFSNASSKSPFTTLSNQFSLTGSFLVENISNTVNAEVGAHAVLRSTGQIAVTSSILEGNQTNDNATTSGPSDNTKAKDRALGLAAAVQVDILHNTSEAIIDGGSRVDASGVLNVFSTLSYPWAWQINNPEGFNPYLIPTDILALFDGTLGFESLLVNTWADAAVANSNDKVAVSGSLNFADYTNVNRAQINAGALINQNPQYQAAGQTVSVNANTTFESVNYAGNTNFDFLPADLQSNFTKLDGGWKGALVGAVPPTQGGMVGVGVSLIFASVNNTTVASVGDADTFNPQNNVDSSKNTIDLGYDPGYVTGQELVYESNGDTPITGLTSGQVYYAIVDPSNPGQIRLAASLDLALAGTALTLDWQGKPKATHSLQAPNGSSAVFDGGSSTNVNLGTSTITFTNPPGFKTGEAVRYLNGGGTNIGGLTSGQVYYAIVDSSNSNQIRLASSAANALAGTALTFSGLGSGTSQSLQGLATAVNYGKAPSSVSSAFDAAKDVNTDTNTISLTGNPGFTTGEQVVYSNGGGISIGGLTNGATYYAIVDPTVPGHIMLASSSANALAGNSISFSTPGSGSAQTLTGLSNFGFNVDANQLVVNVNLATSGGLGKDNSGSVGIGDGGKYGGNGTFSAFTFTSSTIAQIASGSIVNSNPGTSAQVGVHATDNVVLIAVAGAAFKGQNLGIGLSGILNLVTRDTRAIIGADQDAGESTGAFVSDWNVAGAADARATDSGVIVNFALAGAIAASPSPPPAPPIGPQQQAPAFGSWGVQISGDGSYTSAAENVKAYVADDGNIKAGALTIDSEDHTILVGFGGSYAATSLTNAENNSVTNVGFAGSFSEVNLSGDTTAYVQDAHVDLAGTLTVTATRDNYLGTLSASGSGSSVKSSWELAGNVAIDFFSGNTLAYLQDVTGSVGGNLTVTATDNTIYVALGGAVAVGKGGSLGLSIGYISINHTLEAYLSNANLTVMGNVDVEATALTALGSLGLSLGYSPGKAKFVGAGEASVNLIEMTLDAHISDDSDINAQGIIDVEATDHSYLVSLGGGVAIGSKASAAVGAAVGYNVINNTVTAYIDHSTVQAGSADSNGKSIIVSATSSPVLISLVASGADADKAAIGGSVSINSVDNTVSAYINDATNSKATGDLDVTASEAAEEIVVAGSIAVAGLGMASTGVGIGAAIAYNYVGEAFDTANPQVSQHSSTKTSSTAAYISGSVLTVTGSLLVAAGYAPANPLPDVTTVDIDGQTGFGLQLPMPVTVSTQLVSVALGGAAASNFALGGSLTLSYIRETITASVDTGSTITFGSAATVSALDASTIGNGAGGVAFAKKQAAIGAAVAYNDIANNLSSSVINSSITSASGSVSVLSQENATITAVAFGGSLAQNFTLGGSIVVNSIDNTTTTTVTNASLGGGSILISSSDTSQIQTGAGNVEIATGSGDSDSVSVGASFVVDSISNTTTTNITDSPMNATAGAVQVLANSNLSMIGVAAGGQFAATFVLGGSLVVNKATDTTTAKIFAAPSIQATGGLTVSATDTSTITAGTGTVDVARSGSAVGAAVAFNTVSSTVDADVDRSTVNVAGPVNVLAQSTQTVFAAAIGVGAAVDTTAIGFGFTIGLTGSAAVNHLTDSTTAMIENNSNLTTTGGASAILVQAGDTSKSTAIAGVLNAAVGTQSNASVAVGASAAVNTITGAGTNDANGVPQLVTAQIDNSIVNGGGNVTVSASSKPTLLTITAAGSGSFSSGDDSNVGINGAGAGSGNSINGAIQALVSGAATSVTGAGTIDITATDDTSINAVAGGVSIAGAFGGNNGVAVTVGAALAINSVTDDTYAVIQGAKVNAIGGLTVNATNTSSIFALTVGVAGALGSGSTAGVAVGLAGSGSGNTITNHTEALILDSVGDGTGQPANVNSREDVSLTALDQTHIIAGAGTLAFSLAFGTSSGAVSPAIGVSVAINSITSTVIANINASTVSAGGNLTLSATTQPPSGDDSIKAITVAGGADVSGSNNFSVAFAGAGAGSRNTVTDTVTASITKSGGGNGTQGPGHIDVTGNVSLMAQNNTSILADAGGVSLAVAAAGQTAVAAVIGAASGFNNVTNLTQAFIDSSNVKANGTLSVAATSNTQIHGKAFGVALSAAVGTTFAGAAAGSGAAMHNTIANTTSASIQNGSQVVVLTDAANAVSVTATDNTTADAGSGSGSLGFSFGEVSVALVAGVAIANNDITNPTSAFIGAAGNNPDQSNVSSAGGVQVTAVSHPSAQAVAVAVSSSVAIPADPEEPISVALSGAGANATNTITDTVTAAIQNNTTVAAKGSQAGDSVTVSAQVTPQSGSSTAIQATVGTGALSIGVFGLSIGVSLANSIVNNQVNAFVDHASVSTAGGAVNVTALSTITIDSEAVATSLNIAVGIAGAGGKATSEDNTTTSAYIGAGSTIQPHNGALQVSATAMGGSVSAECYGGSGGVGSIGAFLASATVGGGSATTPVDGASVPVGSTLAFVDGSVALDIASLSIAALANHTVSAKTIAVVVGELAGEGTNSTATISGTVDAHLGDGVNATTWTIPGAVSITATSTNTGTTEADGGLGSLGGVSGNVAFTTIQPTIQAFINDSVNLKSTGAGITVAASANNTATSKITGVVVSGVSIGVSDAEATDAATVTAYVGNAVLSAGGDVNITATSVDVASVPQSEASGGAVLIGANGAVADATVNPNVQAYAGDSKGGATISSSGNVLIQAQETPKASANGFGITVGGAGLAVGVVLANATIEGVGTSAQDSTNKKVIASSYLAANSIVSANTLTIQASQSLVNPKDPATIATATAGSGGVLVGVDATVVTAKATGTVEAFTGTNVGLPLGNVTILANDATYQSSADTGVAAAGVLAVGVVTANASSDISTTATLGANPVMTSTRTGMLTVMASGNNQNAASSIAGAGGIVSGDGSAANISDSSTTKATVLGGTLYGSTVTISAINSSSFAPSVNSINASIVGASGAVATTTESTSSTTSIADNTVIKTTGLVTIASQNQYGSFDNPNSSSINKGNAAYSGAGGVITGDASVETTTINPGGAKLTLGNSVSITSGTDPVANPGGIIVIASNILAVTNKVLIDTGGVIEGGGSDSTITVSLDTEVTLGTSDTLLTYGNIGIGTFNVVQATTVSEASTGGAAGTADAHAKTSVTSNQTVTVGNNSTLIAFGNVNLTAGGDPTGQSATIISANSDAEAYTYGGIVIPHFDTSASITSNTTLNINPGSVVESGQNVIVGAFVGNLSGSQTGTSSWNSTATKHNDNTTVTPTTTNVVTQNGTITAGIYHTLNITIPLTSGQFTDHIQIDADGPAQLPFQPTATYDPAFKAVTFVDNHFSGNDAAILASGVSPDSVPVGAYTLGPLYASGGIVTLTGNLQSSSGSITSYGGPSVTVTNNSLDYLVLTGIDIPAIPGGEVFVNNQSVGSSTISGVNVSLVNAGVDPAITVNQTYQGGVGGSPYGPALFSLGVISNLAGSVDITNQTGSFGQTATIYGERVRLDIPNGAAVIQIPVGTEFTGGNPFSEWNNFMVWPGGNPFTSTPDANNAVPYVANILFNPMAHRQSEFASCFGFTATGNREHPLATTAPYSWATAFRSWMGATTAKGKMRMWRDPAALTTSATATAMATRATWRQYQPRRPRPRPSLTIRPISTTIRPFSGTWSPSTPRSSTSTTKSWWASKPTGPFRFRPACKRISMPTRRPTRTARTPIHRSTSAVCFRR